MKKFYFPLFLLLVFAFSACTTNEASQYAGKYAGTFQFISSNTTKDGNVRLTQNPLSTNGLLLYACLPLDYYTAGVYKANSDNVEYMTTILSSIAGASNYIDTATEQIQNIEVVATVDGNNLNLIIQYKVALLNDLLNSYIKIIEFNGTKVS
ncbi:MAG: hypothetical protein K6A41_00660 [Bacteroidales bacterium]|nr:hypothetical protein [Bacteroidales bacterium]